MIQSDSYTADRFEVSRWLAGKVLAVEHLDALFLPKAPLGAELVNGQMSQRLKRGTKK